MTAGLLVAVLLSELALAQVTVALTACFMIVGRLSRWRRPWLLAPGAAGLAWLLGTGVRPAVAGYLALAGHVARLLARHGTLPVRLTELGDEVTRWRAWLPGQIPVGLIVAAAQAALLTLSGQGRRSRSPRRGWLIAARKRYLAVTLRRGELATANGCCLGIVETTGRRAEISWSEAEAGVLCTGREPAAALATGLNLALAAIQHRKAVIIVDLAGGALIDSIWSACDEAGAPLRVAEVRADRIDLVAAVADREVIVATARLVVADVIEVLAERRDLGDRADCLVWINGCDAFEHTQLAALLALGESTGTAVVLGTAHGSAAEALAGEVNVVAVRGASAQQEFGDAELAEALAEFHAPGRPDVLSIRVRGPRGRLITGCRAAR